MKEQELMYFGVQQRPNNKCLPWDPLNGETRPEFSLISLNGLNDLYRQKKQIPDKPNTSQIILKNKPRTDSSEIEVGQMKSCPISP